MKSGSPSALSDYLRKLSQLGRDCGFAIAGYPVVYILEDEDKSFDYTTDEKDRLYLGDAPPPDHTIRRQAVGLVIAERTRQRREEGFDNARDDAYTKGELARAAVAYGLQSIMDVVYPGETYRRCPPPFYIGGIQCWPWSREWWKPTDPITDLAKAGALIIAELERRLRDRYAFQTGEALQGGQRNTTLENQTRKLAGLHGVSPETSDALSEAGSPLDELMRIAEVLERTRPDIEKLLAVVQRVSESSTAVRGTVSVSPQEAAPVLTCAEQAEDALLHLDKLRGRRTFIDTANSRKIVQEALERLGRIVP